MDHTTQIEINGVKMEIDLRYTKRIDTLRIGDRVKVLIKGYSDHKVYPGIIIGFEPFKMLPTVIIAYIETGYNSVDLKFVYFNEGTKDREIVKAIDNDHLDLSKADMLKAFDRQLLDLERKMTEIQEKRDYFVQNFRAYWEPIASVSAEET